MNTKNTDQMDNQSSPAAPTSGRSRRGFASMDPEMRRQIAREGGRAAHASGHAHEFDSEEAREAGRRGGRARWHLNANQTSAPATASTDEKTMKEEEFRVPSSEYIGAPDQADNFQTPRASEKDSNAKSDLRRTA